MALDLDRTTTTKDEVSLSLAVGRNGERWDRLAGRDSDSGGPAREEMDLELDVGERIMRGVRIPSAGRGSGDDTAMEMIDDDEEAYEEEETRETRDRILSPPRDPSPPPPSPPPPLKNPNPKPKPIAPTLPTSDSTSRWKAGGMERGSVKKRMDGSEDGLLRGIKSSGGSGGGGGGGGGGGSGGKKKKRKKEEVKDEIDDIFDLF